MPFKSESQRRWMYAKHPEMAKEWERETPDKKLPEHTNKEMSSGFAGADTASIGEQRKKHLRKLGIGRDDGYVPVTIDPMIADEDAKKNDNIGKYTDEVLEDMGHKDKIEKKKELKKLMGQGSYKGYSFVVKKDFKGYYWMLGSTKSEKSFDDEASCIADAKKYIQEEIG